MAPSIEQNIWRAYPDRVQVLGLDMYNGNNAQLTNFRQSTNITFPLLLKAANGTAYHANRDDIMVVDQNGIVRLIADTRFSSSAVQSVINQVQNLLANPPAAPIQPPVVSLSANTIAETVTLGQSISRTFTLSNTGGSDLVITNIKRTGQTSSSPQIQLSNTTLTIKPGESQNITITIAPNQKGSLSETFEILSNADGTHSFDISVTIPNAIPIAVNDTVRIMPEERVNIPVLQNDLDADNDALSITSVTQGTYSEQVVINSDGTIHYRPNIGNPESDQFTYTIEDGWGGITTATVIVIFTQPETPVIENTSTPSGALQGDFNNSGRIDFPDFLLFAQAYKTVNSQFDLDGDGAVGFGDFLIFAQLYSASQNG